MIQAQDIWHGPHVFIVGDDDDEVVDQLFGIVEAHGGTAVETREEATHVSDDLDNDGEGDGIGIDNGVCEGDGDGDGVCEGDGDGDGVCEGDGDGDGVCEGDGDDDGVCEGGWRW